MSTLDATASCDGLLVHLFELTKEMQPILAFQIAHSFIGGIRKIRSLREFYNLCNWEDQECLFDFVRELPTIECRMIFVNETIKRLSL